MKSVQCLKEAFDYFSAASGLYINNEKSQIYVGGLTVDKRVEVIQASGFIEGDLPLKYLGVPVSSSRINERIVKCLWTN